MLPTLMPGIGKYATRLYVQFSALPWGVNEDSVAEGASPAVVDGDISASSATNPGGFDGVISSTGVLMIDTGGSTARQSFYCDVYNIALRAWYGDTIMWVNNSLPVYDNSIGAMTVQEGTAITPISVSDAVTDAEGDVLTYAIVGGSLPPGLVMDASGNITGTP